MNLRSIIVFNPRKTYIRDGVQRESSFTTYIRYSYDLWKEMSRYKFKIVSESDIREVVSTRVVMLFYKRQVE